MGLVVPVQLLNALELKRGDYVVLRMIEDDIFTVQRYDERNNEKSQQEIILHV
mgnify:CR=1 FL=1